MVRNIYIYNPQQKIAIQLTIATFYTLNIMKLTEPVQFVANIPPARKSHIHPFWDTQSI